MSSRASTGCRGRGETRGTSPGGSILGFDVVKVLGSFKSLGGGGLGEDEIGMKCTYLDF